MESLALISPVVGLYSGASTEDIITTEGPGSMSVGSPFFSWLWKELEGAALVGTEADTESPPVACLSVTSSNNVTTAGPFFDGFLKVEKSQSLHPLRSLHGQAQDLRSMRKFPWKDFNHWFSSCLLLTLASLSRFRSSTLRNSLQAFLWDYAAGFSPYPAALVWSAGSAWRNSSIPFRRVFLEPFLAWNIALIRLMQVLFIL